MCSMHWKRGGKEREGGREEGEGAMREGVRGKY